MAQSQRQKVKLHQALECVGTTTVGERGQVVIPAEVRRELKISPGDKLVVFVRHGSLLGMLKADAVPGLLKHMTHELEGFTGVRRQARRASR